MNFREQLIGPRFYWVLSPGLIAAVGTRLNNTEASTIEHFW